MTPKPAPARPEGRPATAVAPRLADAAVASLAVASLALGLVVALTALSIRIAAAAPVLG